MATKNRDIRLQALIIGGTPIPIGGEGVAVRLSVGTIGGMQRGTATDIKTQPGRIDGTLVISVYPEDAAAPILRTLVNARRIVGASAVPLPGSAVNTFSGETATWTDSHFTEAGDMVLGTDSEIVTYSLALSGLSIVQGAVP